MSMGRIPPPADRIEILLRTLCGERHLRRPLLWEVVDRLSGAGLAAAAQAACDLLDALDHDAPDFESRVSRLEGLVSQAGHRDAAA
jgi:hypothetical protein